MTRASLIVRSIWAACLLVAALNHAWILLRHGLDWDYGGAAPASAVYWSSLTILDPLAAGLLFARPKLGILATVALIATNVAHNLAVTALNAPEGGFLARVAGSPMLLCQIGFMAFVAVTARMAWRGADERERNGAPI